MTTNSIASLIQIVSDTSKQIRDLTHEISDLTALIKIEDVKRSEVERRVDELEQMHRNQSRQGEQWQLSLSVAGISALLGALSSVLLRVIWH